MTLRRLIILLVAVPLLWTVGVGVDDAGREPAADEPAMLWSGKLAMASPQDRVMRPALPPLHQRLPHVPLVMRSDMVASPRNLAALAIGRSGGTLRLAQPAGTPPALLSHMLSENFLAAPDPVTGEFYGNIVESFQANPDNTHFRLQLRAGLKWSDGTPVTTADVDFAYQQVWHNSLLNFMGMPVQLRTGSVPTGTPMTLQIEDDYVFYLSFDGPYGHFLAALANQSGYSYADLLKPAHFLKDFHPAYTTPEKLQQALQVHGLQYEWQLFAAVDCQPVEALEPACRHFPVLWPWHNVTGDNEAVQFVRNPYYFKVDTNGSQLPYIDAISLVPMPAAPWRQPDNAWASDLLMADDGLLHWPAFQNVRDRGLQDVQIMEAATDPVAFYLNFTYADAGWRQVVSRLEFRRALQQAIDRDAIRQQVFHGFGTQPSLMAEEYDPQMAGHLLDAAGLDIWDADGWRLAPDGTPFVLPIAYSNAVPEFQLVAEQIAAYLWTVGVRTYLLPTDPYLLDVQLQNNQIQATLGRFAQPAWQNGPSSDSMPNRYWGRLWRLWYDTDGKQGEEPPAPVQRLFDLHTARIRTRPASAEEGHLLAEIRSIHQEQIYIFNLAEQVGHVIVRNPALRNVPATGPATAAVRGSELFYFASP